MFWIIVKGEILELNYKSKNFVEDRKVIRVNPDELLMN